MLPGQAILLHSFTSRCLPTHSLPPYAGWGLSQSLVLTFMPEPQLWLQASSLLHSPQFPSTVKWFQLDKLAKNPDNVLNIFDEISQIRCTLLLHTFRISTNYCGFFVDGASWVDIEESHFNILRPVFYQDKAPFWKCWAVDFLVVRISCEICLNSSCEGSTLRLWCYG